MSLDEFKQGVMEWYQGEISGEVLANRMLAFYADPGQRCRMAVVLQLETETKARLRPVIMELGILAQAMPTIRVQVMGLISFFLLFWFEI